MNKEEIMNEPFNKNKCHAAVKRNIKTNPWKQCRNRHRPNQIYCGIHLKAKTTKRYDDLFKHKSNDAPITIIRLSYTGVIKNDKIKDISFIVKLQALVRMFLIKRRYNCVNKVDFYTLDLLIKTPSPYFISICDEDTSIKYGYDLRSLKKLLQVSKSNPFTTKKFTNDVLMKILLKIKNTEKLGYICGIAEDKMTDDQKYRDLVLSVFQKINYLGNYADDNWYLKLNIKQLKELYIGAEDIWNYRTQIPTDEKLKIVKNGMLFLEKETVKKMKPDQHRKLSIMIIKEFDKMVSEGINVECKKLGAMLVLTALTEVSTEAAEAMPMYVQNYQDPE